MKCELVTFLLALTNVCLLPAIEARYASININLAMTVSEDSHKLSEDMVRICAQETDISMAELHKFRQNDFKNATSASQCFAHCIYEQMGLMRDGVFVERDVIRTLADVTDPNVLLAKDCHGLSGINKCETAFRIYKCRQEHRMRGLSKEGGDSQLPSSAVATTADPVAANLVD